MTMTAEVATAQETQYDATMLLNALRNVEPHAAKGDSLSVLCALQLTSDGETLTIAATDRYTLASETVTNVERGDTPEFSFLLDRADVPRLLSMLKDAPKNVHYWPVKLTVDGDTLTVTTYDTASTFHAVGGEFPRWRSIMTGARDRDGGSGIPHVCVDPHYLARFAKVTVDGRKNQAMRLYFGNEPTKAIAVEIGETFRAVIMPQRHAWPTS